MLGNKSKSYSQMYMIAPLESKTKKKCHGQQFSNNLVYCIINQTFSCSSKRCSLQASCSKPKEIRSCNIVDQTIGLGLSYDMISLFFSTLKLQLRKYIFFKQSNNRLDCIILLSTYLLSYGETVTCTCNMFARYIWYITMHNSSVFYV